MTPNYSIYAVPAYWVVGLVPHLLSVATVQKNDNGRWNNVNSRSPEYFEGLKKKMPNADHAKFERSRAAHNNSLESFPLVAAALIAGSVAGLPSSRMNLAAAALLAIRALYITLYINTTTLQFSWFRTAVWFAEKGVQFTILIQAANVFASKASFT